MINVQPTIVVGLGEVGRRSVAYLKRRIYEIYQGPLESTLLLTFTVKDDEKATTRKAPLPFDLLPSEHLALDLKDAHLGAGFLTEKYPWLPAGVLGAEGTDRDARVASRLAFMIHMGELASFLQENLRRVFSAEARDAMMEKGLEVGHQGASVYFVAALDDPVGSGLFLDATYLVREMLRRIGVAAATTGIFFLPEPEALDEVRGANVYAALKELDYHMSGNPFSQEYTATVAVDSTVPPFTHGCYLMDTMNERQIALGKRDEASAMLGEWLFQASLTPCKQPLDGAISSAAGRLQMVEGRLADYGSLGLAGYILPIEEFVDWCANRLGDALINTYVRANVSKRDVAQPVSDFENNQSLTPQGFKANVLRAPSLGDLASQTIASLQVTPWGALENRIRGEARQIDQSALPSYTRQINSQQIAYRVTAARELKQQQHLLLNQPSVSNHIPLAIYFFDELNKRLRSNQAAQEKELEAGQKGIVERGRQVNGKGGALFRALSSIPRSALDYLLIGLGVLVGFLAPLILVGRLILSVAVPISAGVGYGLLLLLVILSLGIIGLIIWQMRDKIVRARNDFLSSYRQYVDARINYLNTQQLLAFYPEIIRAVQERSDELMDLYNRVTAIRNDFVHGYSSTAALVGTVDFPLQRSLLTDEFIEKEYEKNAGDLARTYESFLTRVGTPASWLPLGAAQLAKRILDFGRDVFRPLRNNTVNFLLELAPDEAARRLKVQRSARELLDKSAPMWNYNPYVVGQDLMGAGYLTGYGLLSMDDPSRSQLDDEFQTMKADLKTVPTHDPYRMQIIKLRQGYPLYGLRAFNDFRKHYVSVLRDTERPLHIADDYLLAPDPRPYPPDVDLHSSLDALFAVGCVAGRVIRDGSGHYIVALDEKNSTRLATTPRRTVALLGLDPPLAAALSEQINTWVEQHGQVEVAILLEQAVAERDPDDWQSAAMREYVGQLES